MSITGIGASTGISINKAFIIEEINLTIEKKSLNNAEKEISILEDAIQRSKLELTELRDKTVEKIGRSEALIFDAHLLLLEDPEIIKETTQLLESDQITSQYAYNEVCEKYILIFESMDNEYMKERALDIKDVSKRVIAKILNVELSDTSSIDEEVIIVAKDLTPSDTAQLNKKYVKGFVTDIGGRTSHSAIMARTLEIPAVVGTKTATTEIQNGDILIIDGTEGLVLVNPNNEIIEEYKTLIENYEQEKLQLKKLIHEQSMTLDGKHIELAANIGSPKDLEKVLENGADGIGLYRTEFLYMDRKNLPTEQEQFEAYKLVLEAMGNKPVVIRTLDIGGDKELSYLKFPDEMNPFLGYRAIRLCLDQPELFEVQLRALLRASVYGNLKIMFPMIATINELLAAKEQFKKVKKQLISEGVEVSNSIEIGMMIEIPATAVLAHQFAKHVDFFSIGTNDLIQYTFAADRMNEKVSYLYQPLNPALLHLIQNVITAAHKADIWVGMCGEMAGDELAVPILLGMGLDELSMSASSILRTKRLVRGISNKQALDLATASLECQTEEDVIKLMEENNA